MVAHLQDAPKQRPRGGAQLVSESRGGTFQYGNDSVKLVREREEEHGPVVGADEVGQLRKRSRHRDLVAVGQEAALRGAGGHVSGHNGTFVVNRYYTYSGSLTTPECTEPVRWLVLKDPVNVSVFSVDELHRLVSLFPD